MPGRLNILLLVACACGGVQTAGGFLAELRDLEAVALNGASCSAVLHAPPAAGHVWQPDDELELDEQDDDPTDDDFLHESAHASNVSGHAFRGRHISCEAFAQRHLCASCSPRGPPTA